MGDNRGQTIFLSVIGIATLLVTIIGATFAYFTTQVTPSGTGGNVETSTAKVGNTTVTLTNAGDSYSKLEYPGGIAIIGAKATVAKDADSGDTNDYKATFDLKISYKNPTDTDLQWELYKLTTDTAIVEDDFNSMECDLRTEKSGATTYLWYADDASLKTGVCALSEELSGKLGSSIASGTLGHAPVVEEQFSTVIDEDGLKGLELTTNENTNDYYYLVVKYPNQDKPQKSDQGQTINVVLGINGETVKVDVLPASE